MARRRSQAGRFGGVLRESLGFKRQPVRLTAPTSLGGVAYTWDLAGDVLTWGPNAAEVLCMAQEDLPRSGEAFSRIIEPGSGPDRLAAILSPENGSPGSTIYGARYALRLAVDRARIVEDSGRWFGDADGRPAMARGIMRIGPQADANETPSTIIKARTELLTRIGNEVTETRGSRRSVTLIVGRLEGDDDTGTLMGEIGRAIRPLLRRGDHLIRHAPNSFALALTSCAAAEAESAMARLVRLVEASSFVVSEHLRLGAACAPDHATDAIMLLRRAETALATAAEQSLRFAIYAEKPRNRARCGTSACDVAAALNDRRLTFARSPIMDALTRRPLLHEALARLILPDGSIGKARDLTHAMEAAGLSLLLDGRMLELAADDLAAHPQERLALPIAQATLQDKQWLEMLAAHLGARPGIASRLVIVLPEAALRDVEAARGRLDAMKALGIGLAAQGFGTGHISCRQMRHLPIDLLRIDGPLIQTLGRSTEQRLFVRTLIETAHRSGMATVAEWVEDEPTARTLAAWGVDYLQGGLFGEALSLSYLPEAQPAKRA